MFSENVESHQELEVAPQLKNRQLQYLPALLGFSLRPEGWVLYLDTYLCWTFTTEAEIYESQKHILLWCHNHRISQMLVDVFLRPSEIPKFTTNWRRESVLYRP
jgi:hypothetical protein